MCTFSQQSIFKRFAILPYLFSCYYYLHSLKTPPPPTHLCKTNMIVFDLLFVSQYLFDGILKCWHDPLLLDAEENNFYVPAVLFK